MIVPTDNRDATLTAITWVDYGPVEPDLTMAKGVLSSLAGTEFSSNGYVESLWCGYVNWAEEFG